MEDKTLFITVGLPRSGKTTWAREQGCPIVNPDSIRLALHGQRYQSLAEPFVWSIAKLMVRALFLSGHDIVIVDATNNSAKRRKFWEDPEWKLDYHILKASKDLCIERAKSINDEEIIPVIQRMAVEHEPVTFYER